jgi:hypothetical protein
MEQSQFQTQFQTIAPLMANVFPPPFVQPYSPSQNIVSDNDTINIGSGNQNVGGNPSPVTVTQVTTTTYTALPTDYFLCVDVAAPVTITLPTGILGTVYIVKDCDGDATTNIITIQGTAGQLIDGSATALINAPFGSLTFVFTGTEWSIA